MSEAFRTIPKVDSVLNEPVLQELAYTPGILKRAVHDALDEIRSSIAAGKMQQSPDAASVAEGVARKIVRMMDTGLRPVINAAGVIVYTNLGRAPLSQEAIDAVVAVAKGYSDLEYDLNEGKRGSRQAHIRPVTRSCFGAEDALVVNNNAAAVMLVLSSLASGKEVIVSRGELVEIGGSFRMPDVMALSGAVLREVGTTNKTNLSDYRDAISDNTALIMKVHRSNFSIVGFTEEVEIKELASLAREIGVPLFVDMGSGVPFDLSAYGIAEEWTIPGCLEQGSDVLCFSADKVLGG
ncbi:MAG: L-seryl-tRNA(Sec) selenium transferase, partial [Desulfomonilia bacterium]|nr:L-seryl-tRNA(Sec) selenium transferase [Desulfomonilia bacterium]